MRTSIWLTALVSMLLLVGCSGSSEGASEDLIADALKMHMSTGIEVRDVTIEVTENIGDQIEPEFRARSKVELRFAEDFYERVGRVGDVAVVKQVAEKGDRFSGSLITRSTPRGDSWQVKIERFDLPQVKGMAESSFGVTGFVVQDSSDHKRLLAEQQEREQREREELERLAAEAEAARLAKIDELVSAVEGNWSSSFPMLFNGGIYASNAGRKMSFELKFPAVSGSVGQGTLVMYDFDAQWRQVEVPMSFKVADDVSHIVINLLRDTKFEPTNFTIYRSSTLRFRPDGVLQFDGSRRGTEYTTQLQKGVNEARLAAVQRYQELLDRHKPLEASSRFDRLPLQRNTYGLFIITAHTSGSVWGDGEYSYGSDPATAAVHAGLLADGELGVIKITKLNPNVQQSRPGSTRHGITSQSYTNREYYTMELVEKM